MVVVAVVVAVLLGLCRIEAMGSGDDDDDDDGTWWNFGETLVFWVETPCVSRSGEEGAECWSGELKWDGA